MNYLGKHEKKKKRQRENNNQSIHIISLDSGKFNTLFPNSANIAIYKGP